MEVLTSMFCYKHSKVTFKVSLADCQIFSYTQKSSYKPNLHNVVITENNIAKIQLSLYFYGLFKARKELMKCATAILSCCGGQELACNEVSCGKKRKEKKKKRKRYKVQFRE